MQRLIEGDDFYQIRLPSNLVSQPGREYIISSVKARCLSQRDALDEHFVINMDGVNVLGVNYSLLDPVSIPVYSDQMWIWAIYAVTGRCGTAVVC
ncbi:hypothetical protein OROHE_007113 [Orobanche hederae]